MYKVIEKFREKDGKIYDVGESYENEDKERINALLTDNNACKRPFIEEVKRTRKKKEAE